MRFGKELFISFYISIHDLLELCINSMTVEIFCRFLFSVVGGVNMFAGKLFHALGRLYIFPSVCVWLNTVSENQFATGSAHEYQSARID